LDGLERHAFVGQRRHVAVAQLPAIAIAGAAAHFWRALEQGDVVSGFKKPPRRCETDNAAANYDYLLHPDTLLFLVMRKA
jgi:hypothetical protein